MTVREQAPGTNDIKSMSNNLCFLGLSTLTDKIQFSPYECGTFFFAASQSEVSGNLVIVLFESR